MGISFCACELDETCNECHGSGIKMTPSDCGYCSIHCDTSLRTLVDLKQVQQFAKSFKKEMRHKLEKQNKSNCEMDEKEFEQTSKQINTLKQKLDANKSDIEARKEIYAAAKKIYKQQQSPVFIHKSIDESKYNHANALPLTLTMDQDYNTFDQQQFKRDFASKMKIPISAIKIISITAGSVVCHTEISAFEQNGKTFTVGAIAEILSEEEAAKSLVEFCIFLAEFGEPIDQFKPLKQKLIMNPQWNKTYEEGQTYWVGTLNNRKTEPYYCPLGWKKYTVKVDNFNKYWNWPVAYHGTKFTLSMMISFSKLRAGGNPNVKKASGADCFGTGVYFSPSIEYAAHPLYSHPKKMSSNAKQFAGKWVQVVLNCRIKPGSYKKYSGTIGDTTQQIDPRYNNNQLEWLIQAPQGSYLDESQVVFCGYMIRTSDCDPRHLPSSKWWTLERYGDLAKKWYET
eukprot:186843_1